MSFSNSSTKRVRFFYSSVSLCLIFLVSCGSVVSVGFVLCVFQILRYQQIAVRDHLCRKVALLPPPLPSPTVPFCLLSAAAVFSVSSALPLCIRPSLNHCSLARVYIVCTLLSPVNAIFIFNCRVLLSLRDRHVIKIKVDRQGILVCYFFINNTLVGPTHWHSVIDSFFLTSQSDEQNLKIT